MRDKRLWTVLLVAVLLVPSLVSAKVMGKFGRTYEIVEPDFIQEIQDRAAQVDWAKVFDEKKMKKTIRNFQPDNLVVLPAAFQDRSRLIDMTYILDMDIPDGKGGILYPAGYTFNPLDYVPMRAIVVVINPERAEEIRWFVESPYYNDIRTRLLLAGGNWANTTEQLNRTVYYLMDEVSERLKLDYTPSVAMQKDKVVEVTEFFLQNKEVSHVGQSW